MMMKPTALLLLACWGLVPAQAPAEDFRQDILPLLTRYCNDCHSTRRQKGDLDLERFSSVTEIKKEPVIWDQVREQLASQEMPPKNKAQLSKEEHARLTRWIQSTLDEVALASAGDPGPVVLRRLSNMEYTYTVRDLTGVASLDPAREFPVDGAAGEGFTNVGAGLVMSPALLTKYLDAAKEIAEHAVLLPDGIRFSAHTSARDWTDETLADIRAMYARHTESAGTVELDVPGAKVVDEAAGRLPVGRYLDALQGRPGTQDLNPKYLALLRAALSGDGATPSPLLDPLRARLKENKLTAADIQAWQQVLWRFASVGHIGKENGPRAWQEPVTPLAQQHEMSLKLEGSGDMTLYLTTSDAGDGNADDEVVWDNPRLVAPGRPDLPLGQLPQLLQHLETERGRIVAGTEKYLAAAQEVMAGKEPSNQELDSALLDAWLDHLGIRGVRLEPLLTHKMKPMPGHDLIQGWSGEEALGVMANASETPARVPGLMKPHSIAVHPSPRRAAVVAWRSPVANVLHVHGDVADAHPECGNGVAWALEVRRGSRCQSLANGVTRGTAATSFGPFELVKTRPGDVVCLVIDPRDGNHTCDLTAVNLTLEDGSTTWDLAKDVSPDILAGNPHGPWHFLSQPTAAEHAPALPAPLAEWLKNPTPELAAKARQHLETDVPLNSPLLAPALRSFRMAKTGNKLQAAAPSAIEIKIPAALAAGAEFKVTGRLAGGQEGSVQMQVLTERHEATGLIPGRSESATSKGQWSDNNLRTQHSMPVIAHRDGAAWRRFEDVFAEFRALFPIALCYSKIVPADEIVTLTLFYREDEPLKRLMLTEAEGAELDRLWDELLFVSEAPLKQVDVFEQLYQFATQDAKPSAFEPMRAPIMQAAEAFKRKQAEASARQVQAVIAFAAKAWRRPLTDAEVAGLKNLRVPVRLLLARVLTSPAFLYRGENAGLMTGPVSNHELATRLSYFLWSSTPDDELRQLADAGKLRDPAVLLAQTRRMLQDAKVRRLATEFGCQWLHVRDVETLEEKSERHFPAFAALRGDMQEEVVRFFTDLFQENRGVLSLLDADHAFVNGALARHYGLPATPGDEWRRVEGLHAQGRGGILGFAATLSKQSGASRTSPILRGNWLSEVVLGERLPRPPKDVPVLPDEAPAGLTERQLIERHSSDARCAGCHQRIDPFGFALEGFDAIGRARQADTQAALADGTTFTGLEGLRSYLLTERRDDFLRQFCRKLLGYALGRSVQLSDKPLIEAMLKELQADDFRAGTAVEKIVASPQFLQVRGRGVSTNP